MDQAKEKKKLSLSRWLDWLECRLVRQRAVGLISGQGTCLDCRFDSRLGYVWEATN